MGFAVVAKENLIVRNGTIPVVVHHCANGVIFWYSEDFPEIGEQTEEALVARLLREGKYKLTDAEKTKHVEEALIEKFGGDHMWASEVSISPHNLAGAHYKGQPKTPENEIWESSRIDFWTLKNGKDAIATSYEIKVSKADFKRDTERKQMGAIKSSHFFYYVTPTGLLTKEDIPEWAGLMECDLQTGAFKIIKKSPKSKSEPTWQFMAGLIRKSGRVMRDMDTIINERDTLKHALKMEKEKSERNQKQIKDLYGEIMDLKQKCQT